MYPVKRGSLDSVHVCGSQQFAQLFLGDVYGISELIEKIGVEVDTILKVTEKKFWPLSLLSAKDYNIVTGELSQYLSTKPLEIMEMYYYQLGW